MNRQVRLGTFIVTFSASMQGFAQGQTTATTAEPAASKASEPPKTDVLPGGNVTWLIVGLFVGFTVGVFVGRNSVRDVAAR